MGFINFNVPDFTEMELNPTLCPIYGRLPYSQFWPMLMSASH